jgi:hypothetical protein
MELKPAIAPSHLKGGFFGDTGSGKTHTVAKFLSQFQKQYCPESQIAMYDSEPSAGYVAPMVKQITGKDLLAFSSRSFADLLEFTNECVKKKHIAIIDSITHPWRDLCQDYLEAKKSRVAGAGGNVNTVRLSMKDWGPIKDMWNKFSELFVYSPLHIVIIGREGDVWDTVIDEEGKEEIKKTGVKMKTEKELGYEPSLLVQMQLSGTKHLAFVTKERFNIMTGLTSSNNPDIEFFRPHLDMLNLNGQGPQKHEGKQIFEKGEGANWETLKARREAIIESVKDELLLAYPGRSDDDKVQKVKLIRQVFGEQVSWTALESDTKTFTTEVLEKGRETLKKIVSETKKQDKPVTEGKKK